MNKEEMIAESEKLFNALKNGRNIPPLTERFSDISIDDAYHISLKTLDKRLADGDEIVGKKIGVTSEPVQKMLNVHQPDFGFLTKSMQFVHESEISLSAEKLGQPKAEGEIAFRLKKDLKGPGVTAADVLDATEAIIPCFEIVDSRIENWKIKIEDTVADNASCGVYVLGDKELNPKGIDLAELSMKVYKNSNLISEGKGSAVQGNPLNAVAWLANTLGELGIPFKAGEIILSGSLVPLEPVEPGDIFHLEVEGLGCATVNFVK